MFPSPPADTSGALLNGRYRLDTLLGEGATSRVYSGTDVWLERTVAIKVLRGAPAVSASTGDLLTHEARALARLSHPNIITIHDVGLTRDGVAFLVMSRAANGTLEHELERRGTVDPEELLTWMLPVIGALACAHRQGLIHRDLKPSNLALELSAGGVPDVKVLDFGIAKLRTFDTSARQVVGTPAFMAPEQVRADAVGPQTDVWAVGAVLFRALSGRLPFVASSTASLLYRIANERAPRLGSVCPQLGGRLALAIDRALEPDLRLRYESMEAFARALAVAGRQDGLELPTDPEPIGLPDFRAWLSEADVLVTASLSEPAATPATLPPCDEGRGVPTVRPTRAYRALLWALPVCLGIVIATTWRATYAREHETPAATAVRRASDGAPPASTSAVAPALQSATHTLQAVAVPPAPASAGCDAGDERVVAGALADCSSTSSAPLAPERDRTRRHRRRARSGEPPAPPPNTREQIVKQWDW